MTDPTHNLPELAGIATYADAARVGFSVEENGGSYAFTGWSGG